MDHNEQQHETLVITFGPEGGDQTEVFLREFENQAVLDVRELSYPDAASALAVLRGTTPDDGRWFADFELDGIRFRAHDRGDGFPGWIIEWADEAAIAAVSAAGSTVAKSLIKAAKKAITSRMKDGGWRKHSERYGEDWGYL